MRLLAKNNWLAGQSINNGYSRVEEQEETKDDGNGGWPKCHIIKMLFNLRQCLFPHLWFNQAEDVYAFAFYRLIFGCTCMVLE